MRAQPNIVLTGTPGTGKSTHADALAAALPALRALDVGAYARSKALTKAYDEAWASWELDEEALLDALEEEVRPGGVVLDWHCSEIYPERWVDLVVVLTCDHELLWTRLEKRGYSLAKIQENNTAEIMQVSLSEAYGAYDERCIVQLKSESSDDVDANVARIVAWVEQWRKERSEEDEADGAEGTEAQESE